MRAISTEFGITDYAIKKILTQNNIMIRRSIYTHDKTFFNEIDTFEKAYWLGFIYADGYVTSSGNKIGIEIHPKDIVILEEFKKSIKCTNPIKTYEKKSTFGDQTLSRIVISCKETQQRLKQLGITPTKTYDGILPLDSVDEKFKWCMLRGFLDGDGSVFVSKQSGNLRVSFTGTKETLLKVQEFINRDFSWSERHKDKDNNNYSMTIAKIRDIEYILSNIYKEDEYKIVLHRKYNTYIENKK